ncbi:MAG: hypothetical protein UY62_C0012G0024 [Parcubacteria group bacterium GW2011_GWF2_50_9]|nr:MAG: hypothetical protein UY62_C0012G0024 [Parcubacteria group bacterium GW2011_GWF2_50_9]
MGNNDILFRMWSSILEFIYSGNFQAVYTLIIRFGCWLLLAGLLLGIAWQKFGLRSQLLNAVVFYICTTAVFSLNFAFLHRAGPQFYLFTLVISALGAFWLPQRVAFYLSPLAGMQIMIANALRGLLAILLIIQVIAGWQ